jgi:hypothetical protein
MAKTLYLRYLQASCHRGDRSLRLDGTAGLWIALALGETRGTDTTGTIVVNTSTVTGPTNGLESGTLPYEWLSEPLAADFTIAGTITFNLWGKESSTSANVAINAVVEALDGATGALTQIVKTARTTELTATSVAVNFTGTPTSTACKRGDRLRVRVFFDDAGTMATGFTATLNFDRSTAALGESFVTFTENLTFDTAAPSGSTYYLTDADETINPGSATEKVASKTRGGGSVNAVTNTAAGPTAGIQVTASAGGSAIEWYTPPLEAVTLGGKAQFAVRVFESNLAANASLRAEVAVANGDGSGAVVWGSACIQPGFATDNGELSTADETRTAYPSGDDLAVTAGKRLRFRLYVDDNSSQALVTGQTVTVSYNGTTAAAAGDTYVVLPITVTEQVVAATKKPRIVSTRVPVMRAAVR